MATETKKQDTAPVDVMQEVFKALSQLCEDKGNAYWALSNAARDYKYINADKERCEINVAHGEHLAAIEALYLARKIYNQLQDGSN